MDRSRFLEYTEDVIAAQLRPFSVEAIQCLQSWSCILMNEGRGDEIAHVGRITQASATAREVTLYSERVRSSLLLTNDAVWKLSAVLDIGEFEFSRNHVAIKHRDAIGVVATAGYDFGIDTRSQFQERPLPAPSRADIIRARTAIGEWGHTEIDDLLLDIGSSELGMDRLPGSRRDRANAIVRFALENPDAEAADNFLLNAYLVRRAVGDVPPIDSEAPAEAAATPLTPESRQGPEREPSRSPNRVFVVHGQNDDARTSVVSYLADLGLEAIVLHGQPNMGRHLLTKFIQEAELVTFAVVLMTGDDTGCGMRDASRGTVRTPRAPKRDPRTRLLSCPLASRPGLGIDHSWPRDSVRLRWDRLHSYGFRRQLAP